MKITKIVVHIYTSSNKANVTIKNGGIGYENVLIYGVAYQTQLCKYIVQIYGITQI